MPENTAERQYFCYAADGSERKPASGLSKREWDDLAGTSGVSGRKMSTFVFFVGTQEQSKDQPLRGFLPPSCPCETGAAHNVTATHGVSSIWLQFIWLTSG